MFGNLKEGMIAVLCMCLVMIGYTSYTIHSRINAFDERISNLEQRLDETHQAEMQLLQQLQVLNDKTEELKKIEKERIEKHAEAVEAAKEGISVYSDLNDSKKLALNADDMNRIIDGWSSHLSKESVLKGHGEAFIIASRETGLDPVYLLAHAIVESGCGTSYLAVNRNNFFGINAVDSNPDRASNMGDGVDAGIINGAHWIKSNFYDNNYTSLYAMADGGYASNPRWASDIVSVYNDAVDYL